MAALAGTIEYGTLQVPEAFRGLWPSAAVDGTSDSSISPSATAVLEPPSTEQAEDLIFLGVRQTATRLGVHENTIRNWIDRGILRAVRLPGSQQRRMNIADVERVRQGMLGQLASPAYGAGRDREVEPSRGHDRGTGRQGSSHEGW